MAAMALAEVAGSAPVETDALRVPGPWKL